MDSFIERLEAKEDLDLMICEKRGIAYQKHMNAARVIYDGSYLSKCQAYEGSDIARSVNAGRCALISRHLPEGASLIDVGAGTGEFIRAASSLGFDAKGFDVIPEVSDRLRTHSIYSDDLTQFNAVTMWDSIEHVEDPALYLRSIRKGAMLFISVPIFRDLYKIRESKHYRPGEHLYYFTAQGIVNWMALYGFRLREESTHEIDAGRDNIGAFAFCRDCPDYEELLNDFKK